MFDFSKNSGDGTGQTPGHGPVPDAQGGPGEGSGGSDAAPVGLTQPSGPSPFETRGFCPTCGGPLTPHGCPQCDPGYKAAAGTSAWGGKKLMLIGGAAAVLLLVGALAANALRSGGSSDSGTTTSGGAAVSPSTVTVTQTAEAQAPTKSAAPTPSATPSPQTIDMESTAVLCTAGTGSPFTEVYRGNEQTSCPFSDNVASAFRDATPVPRSVLVTVHSPVTGKDYEVTCEYTRPVRCTNSTGALIYVR